jgi:hypothetical protein
VKLLHGQGLELDADVDDRQHISAGARTERPAIRQPRKQPFALERANGFPDRLATDAEAVGKVHFEDTLTWREPSAEDVCAQRVRDVVAKRAVACRFYDDRWPRTPWSIA